MHIFTHNLSNWLYNLYIWRVMSLHESLTDLKFVQNVHKIYHFVGQE